MSRWYAHGDVIGMHMTSSFPSSAWANRGQGRGARESQFSAIWRFITHSTHYASMYYYVLNCNSLYCFVCSQNPSFLSFLIFTRHVTFPSVTVPHAACRLCIPLRLNILIRNAFHLRPLFDRQPPFRTTCKFCQNETYAFLIQHFSCDLFY